jgi:hypothetical protein
MRKATIMVLLLILAPTAHAVPGTCTAVPLGPVEVESNAGSAAGVPRSYPTLGAAFAAINDGILHRGVITIDVCTNVTEGTTPATLNSSGAGSASYTSIVIRPVTTGLAISGSPDTGFGVIQLNGADNVTIDGDSPGTPGTGRDLTIANTAAPAVVATSVIRIATSTAVTSADNNTFRNLVLNGNVTGGNAPGITSFASSSAISDGIYVGGKGGTSTTSPPTAITTTQESAPSGATVNALVVDNNAINQCATGIHFRGAATSVSTGVTITNNTIGADAVPAPPDPPYTSPVTTVYQNGVAVYGTNAVTIMGNTIRNVLSYVAGKSGITLSQIGAGTVSVTNNTIRDVVSTNSGTSSVHGIRLSSMAGEYLVSGNTIRNVQGGSSARIAGIEASFSTSSASSIIERNSIERFTAEIPSRHGGLASPEVTTSRFATTRSPTSTARNPALGSSRPAPPRSGSTSSRETGTRFITTR